MVSISMSGDECMHINLKNTSFLPVILVENMKVITMWFHFCQMHGPISFAECIGLEYSVLEKWSISHKGFQALLSNIYGLNQSCVQSCYHAVHRTR